MKLSDRLETVVSLVEKTETAADIGTDHGHVPVELVRRGVTMRALAMDVRKGPLSRAKESIRAAGLEEKIETRLSDGMEKLMPGEAGAVIIAGMGGELMIRILEQGRHMWDTVDQWILSPHSEIQKVRKMLWENGFPIEKEEMVYEDGKYYTVLKTGKRRGCKTQNPPLEDKDFLYGDCLLRDKTPVFMQFLKEEERKLCALSENLKEQAKTSARAMESLKEAEQKLLHNREVQDEMQRDH